MKRVIITVSLFVVTLGPGLGATAEQSSPQAHGGQLGLGGHLLNSTQNICQRDLDVIDCTTFTALAGLQAHGYFRPFSHVLTVGLLASVDWSLDASEFASDDNVEREDGFYLWRTAVETRFFVVDRQVVNLWFAVELGLASAVDTYDEKDGTTVINEQVADYAFAGGIGLGMDFNLTRGFSIGFELRALYLGFGDPPERKDHATPSELRNGFWPLNGFLNLNYDI